MKEKRLTGDVAIVSGGDGVVALLCSSEDGLNRWSRMTSDASGWKILCYNKYLTGLTINITDSNLLKFKYT